MKKHLAISFGLLAAVVVGTGAVSKHIPHGPRNAVEGAKAVLDNGALKEEYRKLIKTDFYNIENHRGYLDAYLSAPKERHTKNGTVYRDDTGIEKQYGEMSLSRNLAVRDVGLYGLGYFYARQKQADKALSYLQKILNRNMIYLNNTIGFIYLAGKHRPDLARDYFYKEIAVKGNLDGAVANLARLFFESRNFQELDALSRDKDLGRYFPPYYLRSLNLAERNVGGYVNALFKTEGRAVSLESLLTSLVIALLFLVYIYFVDVFEKEKISFLLAIFAMGFLSAVLCTALYDLAGFYLGLQSAGDDVRDLVYYIFGVGLIEETVKALPVLIVVFVAKKWNEPVDILIYASVSALGFACLENAGYFTNVAIGLIVGRSLSAVVMHICLTCLAVYGIFYHRHRGDRFGLFYVFGCFAAAVVLHGLYDYFISSSMGLGILSTVILFLMMVIFRNMLENALNQSPFMRSSSLSLNLYPYLFYGVLCVLSLQFMVLAVEYGFDLSVRNLRFNVLQYYFLAFILIADFGHLRIARKKWYSLWARQRKN